MVQIDQTITKMAKAQSKINSVKIRNINTLLIPGGKKEHLKLLLFTKLIELSKFSNKNSQYSTIVK